MIKFSDNAEHISNTEKLEKKTETKQPDRMSDQEVDAFWRAEFQKAHLEINKDEYDTLLSEVYNRSEDELHIDFDIDDRFTPILEQFSPETWEYLSESERCDAINEFVNALGESLGLEEIPKTTIVDGVIGEYGSYNFSNNTINLNKEYINDPYEVVNTIAHEMRHAYQGYRAGLLETREDLLFKVNLDNYMYPDSLSGDGYINFFDYYDQYVEVDARVFANLFSEAMKNG